MDKTIIYPIHRNLDGVYCRVERNGHFENLCFTDLTLSEQNAFLTKLDTEGLKRMCHLMADALRTVGDELNIERGD
ncbi:MAG: hypothetical protein WC125_11670 [Bacteroidales bacterium]